MSVTLLNNSSFSLHYTNMPMQYAATYYGCKMIILRRKMLTFFLIFAQNIDCQYVLEQPN